VSRHGKVEKSSIAGVERFSHYPTMTGIVDKLNIAGAEDLPTIPQRLLLN